MKYLMAVALAVLQPVLTALSIQQAAAQRSPGEDLVLMRVRALLVAAGSPVGLELRPLQADTPPSAPLPPHVIRQPAINVEVGRTMPAGRAALESFVAANRGYQLIADRPVISIRPIGAAADSKDWLNSPVAAYDVHDVTIVEALTKLLRQFDSSYDASRIRGAMDIAASRLSFTLSQVTVRDVLDRIALAQGAVWIASFSGTTPSFDGVRILFATPQYRTHIAAYPGVPPAEPAPGVVAGPPLVVPLPLNTTSVRNTITRGASQVPVPVGLELGPECSSTERPEDGLALDLTGLDLGEVVRLVLSHCPGYESRMVNGVLNIGTVGSFERSSVMNLRTRVFGVAGMPLRDTIQVIRQVFDPNAARPVAGVFPPPPHIPVPSLDNLPPDRAAAMRAEMTKPVNVKLDKPTLRDALNGLVAAHGNAYWVVDPAPPPARGPRITLGAYGSWQTATTFSQRPRRP